MDTKRLEARLLGFLTPVAGHALGGNMNSDTSTEQLGLIDTLESAVEAVESPVGRTEQYGTDFGEDETLRELKENGQTNREIR
jgi:hypothetical protein